MARPPLMAYCLFAALVACSSVKNAMEDSQRAQSDLKSELGIDSQVLVKTSLDTNWKIFVTVELKSAPSGDLATLKRKVTAIVARDFRSHVDGVELRF